ncbi:MAG: hypothetical protein ABIA76_01145 [Candidatus Diapherotrites archaeon]
MIVLEEIINTLEKLHEKEKSLRKKIHLENALNELRKYDELR